MAKEILNYDSLLAGEVRSVITVDLAVSQTVKRGDLLECAVTETISLADSVYSVNRSVAASFKKPSAKADIKNIYVVAAEDVTTTASAAGTITAYKDGYFNQNAIVFGGESTVADNKNVLISNNIYLVDVQ